jgi:aminoglycoside N3'-acetyltransferase
MCAVTVTLQDISAAIGAGAETLVGSQTPGDIYAPVRELSRQNGYVGLIGVGLNKLTALHQAEKMAGRQFVASFSYPAAFRNRG